MQKTINGSIFRKMIMAGASLLEQNKKLVDALNVFPVPDGDTGTNMFLTIKSASAEVNNCINNNIDSTDNNLKALIKANTDAIAILNGTGEGSVTKTVADSIAAVVAGADESFDTLKEISDWITSHAESASAMNSQILTNKQDITDLAALVGELPTTMPDGTTKVVRSHTW